MQKVNYSNKKPLPCTQGEGKAEENINRGENKHYENQQV